MDFVVYHRLVDVHYAPNFNQVGVVDVLAAYFAILVSVVSSCISYLRLGIIRIGETKIM